MKWGDQESKKPEGPLSYSYDVMLRAEKYMSTYLCIVTWGEPQFRKPKVWQARAQAGGS